MLKDLMTEDGWKSMRIGEEWEQKLWDMFRAIDTATRWISKGEGDYLAGHDFIFKGKRIEVKTNEGADWRGQPYKTCCLEVRTRGGNRIGWSTGKADVVLLVNRSLNVGYFYNAKTLNSWMTGRPTFEKHEADCVLIDWKDSDAGFMMEVSL